jgi:hypothetical protein
VMDDHDLQTLGRVPLGLTGEPRPVGDVLARGRLIRRRAAVARAVPVVVVAVGLLAAGAGVLAQRGDGPPADMATGPEGRTVALPPQFCEGLDAEPVPAGEADGLRLVPDDLPGGVVVSAAEPQRVEADPALMLRALDGAEVEAEIVLEGPYDEPYRGGDEVGLEPTELRGLDAFRTFNPTAPSSYVGFTWTEPDGRSWRLTGVGANEAAVRRTAEALDLDGAGAADDPAAALADDEVPPGFEVTWQAPGLPAEEGTGHLEFVVTTTPAFPDGCEVTVRTTELRAPPGRKYDASPGTRVTEVDVRGGTGLAIEEHGRAFVYWTEAPGVVGELMCGGDVEAALRVAESLEEIPADDPRIAGDVAG